MESNKPRCTKILTGKNKGKQCRNNATVNGLCKLHGHGLVDDLPTFKSDKLGLDCYKDLEQYMKDSKKNKEKPTISPAPLNNIRPPSPPPPRNSSGTSLASSQSCPSSAHKANDTSLSFSEISLPSDASSDEENNNENADTGEPPFKRSKTDRDQISVMCLLGAKTILEAVEHKIPNLNGFSSSCLNDPVWVNSFIKAAEERLGEHAKALSPTNALLLSTVFIGVSVYNKNVKSNPDKKPDTPQKARVVEEKSIYEYDTDE